MARCRISVARRGSVDVKVVVTFFVTRMTLPDSEDRSASRIKSGVREVPGHWHSSIHRHHLDLCLEVKCERNVKNRCLSRFIFKPRTKN